MPNWCFSNIELRGSQEDLDKVRKELETALSANPLDTDFGNNWLGNLLLHIGMSKEKVVYGDVRCRGVVEYRDYPEDGRIILQTSSAWGPHIECIEMFAHKYAPDVKVFYEAEEPGCELYWTNDPDLVGQVYIDMFDGGKFPQDLYNALSGVQYCKKDDVRAALAECLGHDGTFEALAMEAKQKVQAANPDGYLSFHEYEEMPISGNC